MGTLGTMRREEAFATTENDCGPTAMVKKRKADSGVEGEDLQLVILPETRGGGRLSLKKAARAKQVPPQIEAPSSGLKFAEGNSGEPKMALISFGNEAMVCETVEGNKSGVKIGGDENDAAEDSSPGSAGSGRSSQPRREQ